MSSDSETEPIGFSTPGRPEHSKDSNLSHWSYDYDGLKLLSDVDDYGSLYTVSKSVCLDETIVDYEYDVFLSPDTSIEALASPRDKSAILSSESSEYPNSILSSLAPSSIECLPSCDSDTCESERPITACSTETVINMPSSNKDKYIRAFRQSEMTWEDLYEDFELSDIVTEQLAPTQCSFVSILRITNENIISTCESVIRFPYYISVKNSR